jgi:hypothetical protein
MYPHISYRESTGHAWVNCLLHCWPVVGSCLVAGQAASNPALLLGCLDLPDAGWKAEHAQRVSSALSSALLLALALAVGAGPPPPTPTTPPLLHASRQPAAVERTPCLGFRGLPCRASCLGRRTLRAPRTLRFTAGGRCHRARRCWRRRRRRTVACTARLRGGGGGGGGRALRRRRRRRLRLRCRRQGGMRPALGRAGRRG